MQETYKKIDEIIDKVIKFKIEPKFNIEFTKRKENKPPEKISTNELLEIFVRLIAFSQQALSKNVKVIIVDKIFNEILDNYDVEKVVNMNPCDLVEQHWAKVTGIRQQSKFFQIVMFSRLIRKDNSVLKLLTNPPIPKTIKSEADIKEFWIGFKTLQKKLKLAKTPFLRETTTLLHFLLDLGYDCIKPDSAVMKASKKIGIVESVTGEKNLIKAVTFIQNYALKKGIKPSIVDLYLLIEGRQTDASQLVHKAYYN
jgi:hypothetical protein